MKRKLAALLVLLGSLLVTGPASAEIRERVIGVDLGTLIPVGDFGDAVNPLVGGLVRYEHTLQPNLAVTGRIGYLRGISKETSAFGVTFETAIDDIPLWAGVAYRLAGTPDGVFLIGEAGLNILGGRASGTSGSSDTNWETEFGANLGAGYRMGALSFRGELAFLDIGDAGDSIGVLLNVGWDFKGL